MVYVFNRSRKEERRGVVRSSIVPELYVTDLTASLKFYVDILGFEIEYERPEEGFAALRFHGSHLMLEQIANTHSATEQQFESGAWRTADLDFPFGRGINFEVIVPDVESLHARVVAGGYTVKLGLRDRKYRVGGDVVELRQFLTMDPDGYLIRLAQVSNGE